MARRGMEVPIDALGMTVRFVPAETIHTESSYKFSADDVAALAARSGFRVTGRWTDSLGQFAVSLLEIR
jgi:L-histidine N-alpha-methyltransferase